METGDCGWFLGIDLDALVITDGSHTIYIVDDDEAVRDSLTALLEAVGYATRAFASYEAFCDSFKPAEKACLLLDLQLPPYGGEDFLACLSDRARQLPVIVMSGAARNTKDRSLRSGAAAFIEKPLDSDELVRALRDVFA